MNPNETTSPLPADEAAVDAAAAAAPGSDTLPSAEQRLAELEAKHASVSDAYMRAKAEAENTRRRAEEEMSKARKFAVESFAERISTLYSPTVNFASIVTPRSFAESALPSAIGAAVVGIAPLLRS